MFQAPDDLLRHPLSACFPEMPDDEFQALAKSIMEDGQRDSIVIFEGRVIDGWHRYTACRMLAIPCKAKDFPGTLEEAGVYVILKNARRRNLSAGEVATSIAMVHSVVDSGPGSFTKTATELAKEAGVSRRTMSRAMTAVSTGAASKVMTGTPLKQAIAKPTAPGAVARPRPKRVQNPPQTVPTEHVNAEIAMLKAENMELQNKVEMLVDELQAIIPISESEEAVKQELITLHQKIRSLEITRDRLIEDKEALNLQIRGMKATLRRAGL